MRWGLAAVCVMLPVAARAEPVAVGGFVGADFLPHDNELGNSWAPDQVPGSGPSVGGRVQWLALPDLLEDGDIQLGLGVEGEARVAMASTGSDPAAGRKSYAAPVLGVDVDAIAVLATGTPVHPHVVVGGGLASVFTSSPFARDDTDPVVYWGLGASWDLESFAIRADLRQGLEAARMGSVTSTFTLEIGVQKWFGARPAPRAHVEHVDTRDQVGDLDVPTPPGPPTPPTPPAPPRASDRDGDGIDDAHDKCPDQAEDKDGFQDADGCPDPDNDGDGIPDTADKCPNDPETKNGVEDADGCPDALPAALAALDGPAPKVAFAGRKAKLTAAARTALDPIAATLRKFPSVRVRVEGHAGKGVNDELARKRADAVKWYLIDAGVAVDRIDSVAVPADGGAARIELRVVAAP